LKLTELVILTALGDWEIFDEYGVPLKFAGQRACLRLHQAADPADAARSATEGAALAGPDFGSHQRPDDQYLALANDAAAH
jgi:hypothetical protein